MAAFKQLSAKIDLVRRDIQELEKLVEWESTKQQCISAVIMVTDLKDGLTTSKDNPDRYEEWKQRLSDYGHNPADIFQGDILRRLYNASHGHCPKLIQLASRLLLFLCGSLIALTVYQILVAGWMLQKIS